MKKLTLIFAAMLWTFIAYGQSGFGFDFGMSASSLKNSFVTRKAPEYKPVIYPTFHIQKEFKLASKFSLNTALGYVIRGAQENFEKYNEENERLLIEGARGTSVPIFKSSSYFRFNFHYIELPVNFHINLNKVSLFGGFTLAHFMGGRLKSDYRYDFFYIEQNGTRRQSASGIQKDDERIKTGSSQRPGEVKNPRWDYGAQLGVRANLYQKFHVSAEYYFGLANTRCDIEDPINIVRKDLDRQLNRGFTIKLIYIGI